MKKNKILVLGTNSGQLDLIKYMKSIGWYVISCSFRSGEIGESFSDEFYLVDIRDIEAVSKLAVDLKVDIVYSVSSDVAMTIAVKVSEKLGLPHFYDSRLIELFNNKQDLRNHLNEHELGFVNYVTITKDNMNTLTWESFPCIIKPTDSQGQRGLRKIYSKDELKNAVEFAIESSSSHAAIMEDFLDGVELSCNFLINNGNIIYDILSERQAYDKEFIGIPKAHLIPPINITRAQELEAINLVHSIVKSLDIQNGSLYFQMKATSGGIKIIEIAPRLDGCHMWRLIKDSTGRDYLADTIDTLLGERIQNVKVELEDKNYYELVFQHTLAGKKFFEDNHRIPNNTLYHEYRYKNGDDITPINGRLEVTGYYTKTFRPQHRPGYLDEGFYD